MPAIYRPPLRDMQFVMHELLDVTSTFRQIPAFAEVDADTIDQVLSEAGKFCAEVLLPLNLSGDQEGCTFDAATHMVTVPKGYKDAYRQYRDGGWPSLSAEPEFGGQGLPHLLEIAFSEMKYATNQAWTMYPSLAHGAYSALLAHGTDAQKKLYLPKIVSGEWLGTMCLTESHCGTDLGMLRTKAEPAADGSYAITGNKIFISSGEHDMADNIVHLVLARLPDAPAGSKGISLFVVPKYLPIGEDEHATCGARNPIFCGAIEHKMGIHGNATCQLNLDGAIGWMVGEPHKGLAAMFVMMNGARLGVGVQGLGLTEIAYQNAAAYAKDRIQGRSLSGPKAPERQADPIIVHPDVRKMLLTARAYAEGGRAFATWVALQADLARHPDEAVRKDADDMMALMTPIVKAFMTDNGFFAASGCQQVFGGHGYIAEWGIEQIVRDARINMIYEGTNTIQALDLLGRKVLSDNGARMKKFAKMIGAFVVAEQADPTTSAAMAEFVAPLADLGDKVNKLTMELGMKAMQSPDEVGAAAVDYLRVVGHLVYAYFWARMAKIALEKAGSGNPFYTAKLATARFYFAKLLPETATAFRTARAGSQVLMEMDAEAF